MHGHNGPPIGIRPLRVEWSRDRWHIVTPEGQGRDPLSLAVVVGVVVIVGVVVAVGVVVVVVVVMF